MSLVRMRLVGGELQGQALWVEEAARTLNVHLGGQLPGARRTLHYRKSGGVLRFEGETHTPPHAGKEP
ncbi:MAG TPA: hypothetical protein VD793_09325 [Gemmatimonadales bacterium]|nr:hypothetical protein [Gemmatimonadales bacterium]